MIEHICCKDVMSHICDNLGEELQSERCKAIKEHLEVCPCCRKYFASVTQTIECYKKYNINLTEDAHIRLMEKLGLRDCDC
jgi:predicted anti-sigma-YlaC factor YlaD